MRNIRYSNDYRTLMRLLDNHIRNIYSIDLIVIRLGISRKRKWKWRKLLVIEILNLKSICFLLKPASSDMTIDSRTQLPFATSKRICDFTEILFHKVASRIPIKFFLDLRSSVQLNVLVSVLSFLLTLLLLYISRFFWVIFE